MERRTVEFAILGFLIGAGVAAAGYFIGHGFLEARAADATLR